MSTSNIKSGFSVLPDALIDWIFLTFLCESGSEHDWWAECHILEFSSISKLVAKRRQVWLTRISRAVSPRVGFTVTQDSARAFADFMRLLRAKTGGKYDAVFLTHAREATLLSRGQLACLPWEPRFTGYGTIGSIVESKWVAQLCVQTYGSLAALQAWVVRRQELREAAKLRARRKREMVQQRKQQKTQRISARLDRLLLAQWRKLHLCRGDRIKSDSPSSLLPKFRRTCTYRQFCSRGLFKGLRRAALSIIAECRPF
jgi:hypothetical protein